MKLFHFGLYSDNEPQQTLRDALRGISTEYIEHSWINNESAARIDFHRIMQKFKPDVVFMQVQTDGIIKPSTLMNYKNVKFFNFNGDVREIIHPWHFSIAQYCTTLFTNTDWVDVMRSKGFKAEYFQIGFNDKIYTPSGKKEKTKPVVFLGNNHRTSFALSGMRHDLVERFSKKDWFQIYGRGWPGAIDLNYKQEQEAGVYRGAKIGINLSHMDLSSYTSDRMFRIMGSGAMCLAYKHKDIDKEFSNGKNIVWWETLDELEVLIDYYLKHDDEREAIAKAGCALAHKFYTWDYRMKNQLIHLI